MKRTISTLLVMVVAFTATFAQEDLESLLSKMDSRPLCVTVCTNVEKNINRLYENDSISELINFWEKSCGESEPILRLKIIDNIAKGVNSDTLINLYYRNYSYVLMNRIEDSKHPDYNFFYEDNAKFYSNIPLRGNFDSLLIQLSLDIIERRELSNDEKLIFHLFSFQIDKFWDLLKVKEFKETTIYSINKQKIEEWKGPFTYDLVLGAWLPINSNESAIGLNPQFGVSFGAKVKKFQFNILMLVRMNMNCDDFSIIVHSDTIKTNTDIGVMIGGNISYEFFSKNEWALASNLGIGWDIIETGVQKSLDTGEQEYYDLSAVNISAGAGLMRTFNFKHIIGLGVNYHYIPYNKDDNFYKGFNTNYLTVNLFYRF